MCRVCNARLVPVTVKLKYGDIMYAEQTSLLLPPPRYGRWLAVWDLKGPCLFSPPLCRECDVKIMKNVVGMLLVTAVLLIHYVLVPADTTHTRYTIPATRHLTARVTSHTAHRETWRWISLEISKFSEQPSQLKYILKFCYMRIMQFPVFFQNFPLQMLVKRVAHQNIVKQIMYWDSSGFTNLNCN